MIKVIDVANLIHFINVESIQSISETDIIQRLKIIYGNDKCIFVNMTIDQMKEKLQKQNIAKITLI